MSKPPEDRTHRQQVWAARIDAWQSRYDHINKIDFAAAWGRAASLDPGLPEKPPEDLPEEAKRAIVGLARYCEEREWEWS